MDVATISILVLVIGCAVSFAEWTRIQKNDAGVMAAQIRTLETKVRRLEEDLLELKDSEESIEDTVHRALEERIVNEQNLALLQEKIEKQQE